MFEIIKKHIFIIILIFSLLTFFSPFFLRGLLPIPADTIIGLYHPFRDLYAKDYPNGIPFKNFLITDPVRQLYPWKSLAIENLTNFSLPLWNPYEMAGKPLLGNFQSGVFYPLNILFFIFQFPVAWSFYIILQTFLAALFLYLYLNNLKLDKRAIILGVIAFCFSGFFISWLEWGNVGHTALWLPLILLSIDKIFYLDNNEKSNIKNQIPKIPIRKSQGKQIINKKTLWTFVFLFSLIFSFFAGHLQIFFYVFVFSFVYLLVRWLQFGKSGKIFLLFTLYYLLFSIITSNQWIPTLQFILFSARSTDRLDYWTADGWFFPWQHLIQFISPDFFGNPTTLNYWGAWNYGELVGYIGVIPLIFSIYSLFFRYDKKTLFFGSAFFLSLIMALPTPLAKLPFIFNIPFLSTAQPTRLLFISCFTLAILSSLGFDYYLKNKKNISYTVGIIWFTITVIGSSLLFLPVGPQNIEVAKRNFLFPSLILFLSTVVFILLFKFRNKKMAFLLYLSLLIFTSYDLVRFGMKFEPFTKQEYLFPTTKSIKFLKSQKGLFRIASLNREVFPPNFSTIYHLESIEGYDPLYLSSYAEFIAAMERGKANISPPYNYNRIITPRNIESPLFDLLNVKYVLSLDEINSSKFIKVFEEGRTKIYENKNVLPRVFFVNSIVLDNNKQHLMEQMFLSDLSNTAFVENCLVMSDAIKVGRVNIEYYSDQKLILKTENDNDGYLVLSNVYYPVWKLLIDGVTQPICKTDFAFQGFFVPKGEHEIKLLTTLF